MEDPVAKLAAKVGILTSVLATRLEGIDTSEAEELTAPLADLHITDPASATAGSDYQVLAGAGGNRKSGWTAAAIHSADAAHPTSIMPASSAVSSEERSGK